MVIQPANLSLTIGFWFFKLMAGKNGDAIKGVKHIEFYNFPMPWERQRRWQTQQQRDWERERQRKRKEQ